MIDHEIRPVGGEYLPKYASVIRRAFATIAEDFGWTSETAPTFTAFITDDRMREKFTDGYYPFGLFIGGKIVGFVSLTDNGSGVYSLNNLAVLPEMRHFGLGKALIDFCKEKTRALGGMKITLSIVEENTRLKNFYTENGFVHVGTKKFDHLPFTAGYMEWSAV